MKNKLLLLVVLIATFGYAQNVNIPDANFKAYLVGNTSINTNGDSEIQVSEASIFAGAIGLYNLGISDLTGIEAFTALTQLECITSQLTSLDLSANTALTSIDCRDNQLTSINLPSSTALTELNCGENQITSLDVSANTALTELSCYTNQLTSLDVSSNTALTELDFDTNPITSIDVSANTALVRLAISRTQLTSIDVSTNTALEDFFATDCQLTSLDVSAQPNLVLLWCNENQLTSLNIANGNNANMTSFYATDNTALTCIEVDAAIVGTSPTDWYKDAGATYSASCTTCTVNIPNANLKTMLVSAADTNGNNEVECTEASAYTGALYLGYLGLTNLIGVEAFINVTYISCPSNNITSYDFSANTQLTYLNCNYNSFTNLEVSSLTNLETLIAGANNLTDLDVSANTSLEVLNCASNSLTSLNVANGNNSNFTFFKATNNPNLTCIEVDDVAWSDANWVDIDATASFSTSCATCTVNIPDANFKAYLVGNTLINTNGDTEIQCSEASAFTGIINCTNLNISDLTGIEAFTALTELYCQNNQLTSLDVSANTSLQYLFCGFNQLTSLDVSTNTALISIDCTSNQLTSLDGSVSTALTQLKCQNNQLTSLDVSNNTALISFECYNNSITSLDLSANTALTSITSYANNLASLNIANGFNTNLTFLSIGNNPSLTCIQVDANIVGTSPNNWYKDAAASYSDDCTPCTINIPDANFKAALVGDIAINTNGDTEIQCSEATDAIGTIYAYNDTISDLTGIEAFTNITALYCYDNNLTSLDVSANIFLIDLFCDNNNLTSLNIANGNNANMINFDATSNAALTCIQVDAGFTPNSAGWQKDAAATYSVNCGTVLSVTDVRLDTVSIYPNPATSVLHIEMTQSIKQVTIYSMLGNELFHTQNNTVDVSTLSTGLFLIKIEDVNGTISLKKFLKK